ncbi:MAG: sigma-70 family RNA polymerase sigma factor [Proteobacteria bacterium]|nr:sigma-70 family RNA polymerase sigma factor [Pseudomonadota bacterium]
MSTNEAVLPSPADVPGAEATLSQEPPHDQDLGQFLRENNNALVSYVYSWVRSRPDALDIVQEAYCRIFRLGDLKGVNHLRGYLFKTAKNIATDWVRQRVVREAYVHDEPLRGNKESASPEDIWLAREELEALERNVKNLPPKCKCALIMVRLEGASYEEVGQHLGIKTHSARRLVERAMEYLLEKKTTTGKSGRKAKRRTDQEATDSESSSAGDTAQLMV